MWFEIWCSFFSVHPIRSINYGIKMHNRIIKNKTAKCSIKVSLCLLFVLLFFFKRQFILVSIFEPNSIHLCMRLCLTQLDFFLFDFHNTSFFVRCVFDIFGHFDKMVLI